MVVMAPAHRVAASTFALLLLLVAAPAVEARGAAEEPLEPAAEAPVVGDFPVPLLFVFSYEGGERSTEELEALRRSAAAAFAVRRPSARILLDDGGGPARVRERAIARAAVGWVELSVREEEAATEIEAAAYAVAAIGPAFDIAYREPPGLTGPRLRRAWTTAAEEFDRTYEELVELALADIRFTPVTVHAVPGTTVEGLGETPRTVPDSGMLEARLPSPLAYAVTARAPRHYPAERLVLVLEEAVDVTFEQPPRSPYSWELALANASYPSFEVARRLGGDYLFARGGFTTYLLGIVPFHDDDDELPPDEREQLFRSDDLTVLSLQLGSYLHPPYGRFRAYAAGGALLRVIHTSGYRGRDPVAPWGVVSTLGVESRPSERWRLFFEWQPALYPTDYPEILMRRLPGAVQVWGDEHSSAEEFFIAEEKTPAWVLSGATFRLGVRWQP